MRFVGLPVCFLCVSAPGVDAAVKSIDAPGGGKIVYGEIDGQTTETGAMSYILRSIHSQFGERPQVSTLFQVHGTQSIAAFFDRSSKAFSDYLLDNSVAHENATGAHGTLSNGDAEALIQQDPGRFEHVSTPNLQKGLDY